MSIAHIVSCDACGNNELYGRTHIALQLQPSYPRCPPMKHFCDSACLHRFFANLDAMCRHHATGLAENNRQRSSRTTT